MEKFFKLLKKVEKYLLVALMTGLTIVSFLQVFYRVFLSKPLPWTDEASRYLFVWTVFIGAVIVMERSEHFNIDLLVKIFPSNLKRVVKYLVFICIGIFSYIMIKYGYILSETANSQITPALRLRMSNVYIIIPISGILMLVHLVEHIYKDIKRIEK